MTGTLSPPSRFELKGWHVLAIVVGFFGIVVGVDVAFMVTAYRTHPGEVSATPYEDGVAYNQSLAQQRAQAALGWRAVLSQSGADIQIRVSDRLSRPLEDLTVKVRAVRPATEAGERSLSADARGDGVYGLSTPSMHGAWDLNFTITDRTGHRFEALERVVLP